MGGMSDRDEETSSRVCGVCGAKALGYNFNAITCESCKAFFRRNALRDEKFKCLFGGQCVIDSLTRKFCQRCRLDRCFALGMRRDWILTDSEKEQKRRRRARERRGRVKSVSSASPLFPAHARASTAECQTVEPGDGENEAPSGPLPQLASAAQPIGRACHLLPRCSAKCECCVDRPGCSQNVERVDVAVQTTYSNQHWSSDRSNSDSKSVEELCCLDVLQTVVAAEFCDTSLRSPDVAPSGDQSLNPAELAKLQELLTAHGALTAPLSDDNQFVNMLSSDPSLINLINLCDVAIRRLVKMAKMVSGFCSLCQKDQIALLKGGCTELMILCGVGTYDPHNISWNIPASQSDYTSIKLSVLKKAPYGIYGAHKNFSETFPDSWKSDARVMSLLMAITLFCPVRLHLQHRQAVRVEQECYYYLLRRYMLSSRGGCSGRQQFLMAVQKLRQLRQLNDDHIKVFLEVNPHDVEPLLIEIFDLHGSHQASHAAASGATTSALPVRPDCQLPDGNGVGVAQPISSTCHTKLEPSLCLSSGVQPFGSLDSSDDADAAGAHWSTGDGCG